VSQLTPAMARRLLLAGYGVVALAPLALIFGVAKPGTQGRLVIFADALGFAALSLIALQLFVSGRWAATTKAFGLRSVLALHRQAGTAVLVLVMAHVVGLVIADPSRVALLDPATAPARARAGMLALVGLVVLGVTSSSRRRLGLRFERWRALHIAATVVVIAAAFAHVLWVDAYSSIGDVRWTVLGLTLLAAGAVFWTRVAMPYATALRPYRVVEVRRERGQAVTLELAAQGHGGLRFRPGQFARVRTADALYGMGDHPFSLSSSALRPERPAFTVKALGDFSASLAQLPVGTEVLVDGPHGEVAHDEPGVRGRLLVVAGIGITPALSVLRTAAEQRDDRPLRLVYGNRRWMDVTFAEELEGLQWLLPGLRVVHVLSRPDPGWRGERGRICEDLLGRHLPRDLRGWSALVCGPPEMVETARLALRNLGLPADAIQAEGFA
jgi:predicted ferric reductase